MLRLAILYNSLIDILSGFAVCEAARPFNVDGIITRHT